MKVEYNGIVLDHAFTESWDEQIVYDSSGVNVLGNKITMTFQGNVYPATTRYSGFNNLAPNVLTDSDDDLVALAPVVDENTGSIVGDALTDNGGNYSTFAKRLNVILRRLSMPRHNLFVSREDPGSQNPVYFFKAYPQGFDVENNSNQDTAFNEPPVERRNVDVNNGPKPISVKVVQKTDIFALISFTIEVTKIRCLGGETSDVDADGLSAEDPTRDYIVSHRCWTDESFDNHFYCTRVTTGKIQVTHNDNDVHWVRHVWRTPLEVGFRRESVRFSQSEDGLSISYVITDKQTQNAAPYPATSFSGNVSYSVVNCAETTLNMSITLEGRIDCPRAPLIVRGMQAVTAKLRSFAEVAYGLIERLTVSENIGDPPTVTVNMTARLFSGQVETPEPSTLERSMQAYALFLPMLSKMGDGVSFDAYGGFGSNGSTIFSNEQYNRLLSSIPNPDGYNPYVNITRDASSTGVRTLSWENIDRYDTTGYIKALVSDGCSLRDVIDYKVDYLGGDAFRNNGGQASGESSSGDSGGESDGGASGLNSGEQPSETITKTTFSLDKFTNVFYDESLQVIYNAEPSQIETHVVAYPYTVYKSDITYSTDFNRAVLPQKSAYATQSEVYNKIVQLQAMDSAPYIDAQIASLRKQMNSARVVELSNPVPTARVVIEAERLGRMPDLPDPNEVVTYGADDLSNYEVDKITFTPIGTKTSHCDTILTQDGTDVVCKVVAVYDYVMSRRVRKGDKIMLLSNPIYERTARIVDDPASIQERLNNAIIKKNGQNTAPNVLAAYANSAIKAPYSGGQLNHQFNNAAVATTVEDAGGTFV